MPTKKTAAATTIRLADLPALGAELAGGIYCGVATKADGTVCAIALLPDVPEKRVTWSQAKAWAKKLKAELPARPVSALLFATARKHVEPDWYWTCEEHETYGSCAWFQFFDDGFQSNLHKSYEGRARAVRLIHVAA
jgi:hypothetical protein